MAGPCDQSRPSTTAGRETSIQPQGWAARSIGRPPVRAHSERAVATFRRQRVGVVLKDADRTEPGQDLVHARIPVGRPLLNHLEDQVVEFGRDQLVVGDERQRPLIQVLLE